MKLNPALRLPSAPNPDRLYTVLLNDHAHGIVTQAQIPSPVIALGRAWLLADEARVVLDVGEFDLALDWATGCVTTHLWQGPQRVATAGLAWDAWTARELWQCLVDLQEEWTGRTEPGPMPAWRPWLAVQVAPEYVRAGGANHAAQVYRFHWVVAWVVLHHLPELRQRN